MPDIVRVITYPDPFLRRSASDVEEVDNNIRQAVEKMLVTMYTNKGVGLAAPQVGLGRRIVVVNASGEKADEKILINPTIVERRGAMEGEEGCLSFPGVAGVVRRSAHIVILAYDIEGKEIELPATDFASRVLQHEIDHLEGMLFVDRMTPESRVLAREALKALEESYGQAPAEYEGRH